MTVTLQKSHLSKYANQEKLRLLNDDVTDNIEELFQHLNVEYQRGSKLLYGTCPVHGGDNKSAFNLYCDGHTRKGYWRCQTHGCHDIFMSTTIGLIRGILSHAKYGWSQKGDQMFGFGQTVEFLLSFLSKDYDSMHVDHKAIEKTAFANQIQNIYHKTIEVDPNRVHRKFVRKHLDIPATYYLQRGYSSEILDKYDIGLCTAPNKEMSERVVVPIYDDTYTYMVGCSGRSIHEKCKVCGLYHKLGTICPTNYQINYMKWRHSVGFSRKDYLYNFWFAKQYIVDSNIVMLVESPGNVWRLEEAGIHNSVAVFGSSLTDEQKSILDKSGALAIIVIGDNDDGGEALKNSVKEKCDKTYKIYYPKIPKDDIGEMTVQEIKDAANSWFIW